MNSHKTLKTALFAGLLLSAYGSSRAFVFFDFDDFDDYFNQLHKREAHLWRELARDKAVSEESIVLPEIITEPSKDKQRLTMTITGLKGLKAEDIKTTYTGDNRVVITFPYAKGTATVEVYPRGYGSAVEKEITQTNEKKGADGTVISTSSTSYRGYNGSSASFGFKIDPASIKKAENQPKLEGENLVLSFDAKTAEEVIAVKSAPAKANAKKSDMQEIVDIKRKNGSKKTVESHDDDEIPGK